MRAGAAFGVVLLHCCVPYMDPPVPGLAWSVRDTPSWLAGQCFWVIELFIMPLFLMLAGYFAWQTCHRCGIAVLVQSRARRLLVPLLFGMVVILPLDLYAWLLGWVTEGWIAPQKLRSLKFDGAVDRDLWGLSHLWFLQYLFLYVLALAGGLWMWQRSSLSRRPLKPVPLVSALFLAAVFTLYVHPEVVWGFQHAFLPVLSKWIYSGIFFALGIVLAAYDGQLDLLKRHASRLVAPAVLLSLAALIMGSWHLRGGTNQLASMTLAATTCAAALTACLAIIGVSARYIRMRTLPQSVSYLAAASFWVYMFHHPLIGLVHVDLKWLLPTTYPIVKVALAFMLVSALSLVTYEYWVRQSALGRLLGFEWQPTRARATTTSDAGGAPEEIISIPMERRTDAAPKTQPRRRAA